MLVNQIKLNIIYFIYDTQPS